MEQQFSLIMRLRKNLSSKLEPMRYEHSLSVSFTCMNLAMRYGYDLYKAELAGLMHDCAKCYTDDIILKKCVRHGIRVTEAELKTLPVLHAKYGVWLAEHRYQIEDREILDAIACHTTGRPDMTILDKILYVADYIEPRRFKAGNLSVIRMLAYQDLDEAVYAILYGTLEYLNKKGGNIDPMTFEAYEYYKKLKGECNELKGNGETGLQGPER